jgi:glycosyltransferase involved in cell wall biosynthesis
LICYIAISCLSFILAERSAMRPPETQMANRQSTESPVPLISIVIAVYNDWKLLDRCLRSLAGQVASPKFEVIVVDDGSRELAPEQILQWHASFPLLSLRQSHQGISIARNFGVRRSTGSVLLFVDADCRFHQSCLAALASTMDSFPQEGYFQLRLTGDCSTLVGRVEHLRLLALQNFLLQADGHIRYLNTAGFATRRSRMDVDKGLFEPAALRAEDTLLLANLILRGDLPLFARAAIVEHAISLSLLGCIMKDMRSAFLEARTYDMIASQGVRVRITHRERLRILISMWKASRQDSIGRLPWFVLSGKQTLRWMAAVTSRCLPHRGIPADEKFD